MAGHRIGHFHVGESDRGLLGDGVVDFDPIFDALLDVDCAGDVVFESFPTAVADESLSQLCAIWRDTWTGGDPPAAHARTSIELRRGGAPARPAQPAISALARRADRNSLAQKAPPRPAENKNGPSAPGDAGGRA